MFKTTAVLQTSHVLTLIILCFLHSSFSITNESNDLQSLLSLRNSLAQRRNLIPSWFNSEVSACNWSGIRCVGSKVHTVDLSCTMFPLELPFPNYIGEFRELKYLNLSNCALIGHVPSKIWNLGNLESLDLGGNRLSGILPPIISTLKVLKYLVLDGNSFSGSLPSTIGLLKGLSELSVQGNLFSGNLPVALGELQNLESLDLSSNTFAGSLPSSIGNLTSLFYLDASRNKFTGTICTEIGNLGRLLTLDLSWNSLTGPIPSEIGRLVNLTILKIGNNNLNGRIPAAVGNLRNLEDLDLESCRFTGDIPEEISNLKRLTSLNLAQNSFEGELPASFGELANLMYLVATNAGLSGRIPGTLGKCKGLKILNLSFNSFSGPLPDGLMGLKSIDSVVLTSNSLSGPIPEWISNWEGVNSIVLGKNFFNGSLPPLNMQFLNNFDITSNQLSGEIQPEICNASSLTTLYLSENEFTGSIEKTFMRCLNLTDLQMFGNNLFGEIPGYLGELPLVTLELSHNKFSGKLPDQLWESQTLMELSLSNNLLEGEIPGTIAKTTTLQRIQLDNNLFEGKIPISIGKLQNLTNLSVSRNKLIGGIPLELFDCINLVSLDLSTNELTGPIPKLISQLKQLDNLVLSQNRLSGPIPDEICSGFLKVSLSDSEYVQHYGRLDLSYNEFVGPIPASINECTIVSQLLLQGNKLNGSIPQELSGLTNLTSIDLSFNYLTGPALPQFFSLRNLQGLLLSRNELNGSIPEDLGSMIPSLTKLNLSSNSLTGPLPPSIFNIESLSIVDISLNSLSGPISFSESSGDRVTSLLLFNASNNLFSGTLTETLSNLTTISVLDVHNNSLTGSLPLSLLSLASLTYLDVSNNSFQFIPCKICDILGLDFVKFSGNKFKGNAPGNCAASMPCLPGDSFFPSLRAYPPPSSLHRSYVLGIAIGSTFVVVVLFFAVLWWSMLRQEGLAKGNTKPATEIDPTSIDELLIKKHKEPLSINIATFEHSLQRLDLTDIVTATENFNKTHVIGDGGFGTVYKGLLPEGRTIAIKRLNGGHFQGDREFLAEMETIGKVKHENLVPLLGYCVFGEERFLIYEYMENGSLDVWLRNRADAVEALDWPTRFKICLGSARGISFLHHGFVPHIIHRDIKSSNILLDSKFKPLVSDFGLARIISACESHVSTILAGTFGYIPPEYGQSMVATTKGDVYSFGVVMLEMLTGRAPTGQADIEGGNLVGWVRWMMDLGMEDGILDPYVLGMGQWKDQMSSVLAVARACTLDEPWKRPTMLEVNYSDVERVGDVHFYFSLQGLDDEHEVNEPNPPIYINVEFVEPNIEQEYDLSSNDLIGDDTSEDDTSEDDISGDYMSEDDTSGHTIFNIDSEENSGDSDSEYNEWLVHGYTGEQSDTKFDETQLTLLGPSLEVNEPNVGDWELIDMLGGSETNNSGPSEPPLSELFKAA
ncbi:hypothetical protein GIB67_042832 [Kingdonia uniflora]|uniref:non-specific serine/threonine protein kinase n=1 Tax=Kingdonia uniflora TaxID=39325 RepID=A0A7J7NS41_9MAGN|nr:hypothetical protein GIB67_042832 [Kingdonia uniflora]